MTRKTPTGGINQALIQFHSTVPTIPMNGVNPFHRSKYARLEDILKVINKPLTDAGLVIIHRPEGSNVMSTEIRHADSGETITANYELIINGIRKNDGTIDPPGPQQWSSAITYAKRVSISCLLNLCLDSDDDAEAAQNRKHEPQRSTPQSVQRRQAPQQNYGDEGDDHPWLNKGRDLDDIKKALAQGSMMMETDRGPVTRFIESATGSERIFKVNNKTKGELQEILQPARAENNRSFDEQRRRHDGPHPF